MDISGISQLVGSLGFPIAACIALYYSNMKQDERHQVEIDKITEALNQNTIALTKIETLLSKEH